MGIFNLLTGLAGIVGPLAGGYSKDLIGPQRSFYVLLAGVLVLTFFTFRLPRLDKGEAPGHSLGGLAQVLVTRKPR
jgi:predicted MFS family arabinose efflux permease